MSLTLKQCAKCECGKRKCRDCLAAADSNCQVSHSNKNSSKVSEQTHIVEELSETGEVQYHCTACRKRFRSRTQKYYHLQCNLDQQHQCDICKKTFSRSSQLKYHQESHSSPINKCPKCQKTFSNPLALKKHESLHKVEPKPCPHCDKTFLKKSSLEEHIAAQHLHQLQYGCAYCNKKYASKSTLQQHLQSHEKKRFECAFCGKLFQRNSILNLHLKRHYHTNTYTCPVCDKIFTESGALTRHRKIHEENVLQYHCILCNKNILRKDNMARHMITIHPEGKYDDIVQVIKPSPENPIKAIPETCEKNQTDNGSSDTNEQVIIEREHSIENVTSFCEANPAESHSNVVIIENMLLQRPLMHASNTEGLQRTLTPEVINDKGGAYYEEGYSKVYGEHFNSTLMESPQRENKIHVITALPIRDRNLNELETPSDKTLQKVLPCNFAQYNQVPEYQTTSNSQTVGNTNSPLQSYNTLRIQNSEQDLFKNTFFQEPSNLQTSSSLICSENNSTTSKDLDNIYGQISNQPSVIRSIGNVKKKILPNIYSETITPTNTSLDYEYKHKKYNRHYNVDLYRKILGCDDDDVYDNDDVERIGSHQVEGQQEHHVLTSYNLHQDNSSEATNTATVHWRKCFKNIYETSTS